MNITTAAAAAYNLSFCFTAKQKTAFAASIYAERDEERDKLSLEIQ